jgi:diketogulonate reductase-like aldo/keto reductase
VSTQLTGPQETIELPGGVRIPQLGLGVFRAPAGGQTAAAVQAALRTGYRHIDTARIYGNEADVGAGLRASGLDREQVFITTKLWNDDHGYARTLDAFEASRRRLGLDYVDLYLVHWPVPRLRADTWRAMEHLLDIGKVRAIGVSNYMVRHLHELLAAAQHPPAVNQIELSPYNYRTRRGVLDLCQASGIAVEAYSPLTKGRKLTDPPLVAIAEAHGKSTAQVLIRWALQMGLIVLPKSTRPERIAANADVYGFALTADDMTRLDALDEGLVTGWDPTDAP